jgi:hypothetical protein
LFDFFDYFVNREMIEKIIHNTSLRLLELNDEELTYTEFQSFIGLLLLFGVT